MTQQLLDLDLIKCPDCGHVDTLDGFDIGGACSNNVFCIRCHCEFDSWSLQKHDGRKCPECVERRRQHKSCEVVVASMTDYMELIKRSTE